MNQLATEADLEAFWECAIHIRMRGAERLGDLGITGPLLTEGTTID